MICVIIGVLILVGLIACGRACCCPECCTKKSEPATVYVYGAVPRGHVRAHVQEKQSLVNHTE